MPYNTIQNPGVGKAFSILADAFAPKPESIIAADLNAKRRDLILAQTQGQNLENQQEQGYMDASTRVQDMLRANPNLSDQAERAKLIAEIAGVRDGYKLAPAFAAGASTYVNPNFVNQSDLSTILLGTGVVPNYGNTPAGQGVDNAAAMDRQTSVNNTALERQRLSDAAEMERLQYQTAHPKPATSGSLAELTPKEAEALYAAANERLTGDGAKYEGYAIDPELQQALRLRLAENYQQSKNAEAAVAAALAGVPLTPTNQQWGIPFSNDTLSMAPSAPQAAAPAQAASGKEQVRVGRKMQTADGKVFEWTGTAWVPVKGN